MCKFIMKILPKKYFLIKKSKKAPMRLTPYIECSAGYGFALSREATGGIYVNPSIGVSYSLYKRLRLMMSVGYELQKLERLKRIDNEIAGVEFSEIFTHNLISIKIGIEY